MSRSPRRLALRAGAVLTVATAVVLVGAAPAFAHVTAEPGTAEQGGYSVITLRVPNESDTAGTVGVTVNLPAEHPFGIVFTSPVPGWTASTTSVVLDPPVERGGNTFTEVVNTVTWTAQPGVRLDGNQFLDFPLYLGPLPEDVDTLVLPTVQTYDDGDVVAWDQPPTGGAEAERPAPTVSLTPATGDGHGGGAHGVSATATTPVASASDDTARWMGGAGLLVGALGLGVGGGALLRGRGARKDS